VAFEEQFRWTLAHGLLVAVDLPATSAAVQPLELLPPEEAGLARDFAPPRQLSFAGGRIALARALETLGISRQSILWTPRGAPQLPGGVQGSLSHKRDLAVALAALDDGWTRGVDVEELAPRRLSISHKVLTPDEQREVATLDEAQRVFAVMARFSLKESLYKALDPHVQRYVGFDEAEVTLGNDGHASARLLLKKGEGPFEVELAWRTWGQWVISTSRIRRRVV
jgi:phosphopantetheine--protein transferase-like protein